MTNMMETAQAELRELLMAALGQLVAEGKIPAEPIPAFKSEVPADTSHGDLATKIAMASSARGASMGRISPARRSPARASSISLWRRPGSRTPCRLS